MLLFITYKNIILLEVDVEITSGLHIHIIGALSSLMAFIDVWTASHCNQE